MNVWQMVTILVVGVTLAAACTALMVRPDLVLALLPRRRRWQPTSAMVARERIEWCVRSRRNGGTWEFQGHRTTHIRQGRGGPVIAFDRPVVRWRRAA